MIKTKHKSEETLFYTWLLWEMNINVLVTVRTRYCHSTSSKICFVTINNTKGDNFFQEVKIIIADLGV